MVKFVVSIARTVANVIRERGINVLADHRLILEG